VPELVGEEDEQERDGVAQPGQDERRRDPEEAGARVDESEARVVPDGELDPD